MYVLRCASRAVRVGLRTLLRQLLGLCAHLVATASSACAHKLQPVAVLVAMKAIVGSDAQPSVNSLICSLHSGRSPQQVERQQCGSNFRDPSTREWSQADHRECPVCGCSVRQLTNPSVWCTLICE